MVNKRKTGTAALFWLAFLPLWGGTGRPSDGFLSFILLFGFLVLLLGLLQVGSNVKRRIQELLKDIY